MLYIFLPLRLFGLPSLSALCLWLRTPRHSKGNRQRAERMLKSKTHTLPFTLRLPDPFQFL